MRRHSVLRLAGIIAGGMLCVAVLAYAATSLARGVYMTVVSSSWLPKEATVHSIHSRPMSADLFYQCGSDFRQAPYREFLPCRRQDNGNVDPADPGRSVAVRRSLLTYVWVDVAVILLTCVLGWRTLRRQTALLLEDEKTRLSRRTLAWIAVAVSGVVVCLLTLSNEIARSVRLVMAAYVILVACLCFAALGTVKCAELMRNGWVRVCAGIGVLANRLSLACSR